MAQHAAPQERTSTMVAPRRVWWVPLGLDERIWVSVVVAWALIMFVVMMFIWPLVGKQGIPTESYRTTPAAFHAQTIAFVDRYQSGTYNGIPVVTPPPGGDVFVEASMFQFRPIVQLKKGETYRFLLSSTDVEHGFSIELEGTGHGSLNYQVLPGYVKVVYLTPYKAGEFPVVCNEFCGLGHHEMTGLIIVEE